MTENRTGLSTATRRSFLKTATAAAAGATLASLAPSVYAAGSDVIKVGVIGCGFRGRGAAENVLHAAPNVQVVALGDVFKESVNKSRDHLNQVGTSEAVKKLGNKVDLPDDRCFIGLDAYEKVLNSGVNYVILAAPPGFRPLHVQAAVAAGKHIFAEKPVGVDGPGIRKILDAYELARKKKLGIAAGTQRRHQNSYLETIKRLHSGEIGDIVAGRCFWNQGILWKRERQPGMSDVAYQIHNWYNFTWLSGDHIVEQHVHNLDVLNWVLRAHPIKAIGMGFRTRTDPGYGHTYDFFAVDYAFPNGVQTMGMCRQISDCTNEVAEYVVGTKGTCRMSWVGLHSINGKRITGVKKNDPYVQEHTDLIESIRRGEPINELKNIAESTLTAVMGRMSAYTGKTVTWEQALHSLQDLMPPKLTWDMSLSEPPVPIPGKTPLL